MAWLSADDVLRVPSEQLGILILHRLDELADNHRSLHNFTIHYLGESMPSQPMIASVYTDDDLRQGKGRIIEKLADAWAWLEQQRYLGPDPGQREGPWRVITERGKEMLAFPVEDALARIKAGHLLGEDLHPRIEREVRAPWNGGKFETAIFQAAREIEIAVGEALPPQPKTLYGTDVINAAFGREKPLADPGQTWGEQEGTRALYAGFIATFKNPGSHRHFEPDDPIQAAEIVRTADLLMRMLDDRLAEMQAGQTQSSQAVAQP